MSTLQQKTLVLGRSKPKDAIFAPEGKKSSMTLLRIQELKAWVSNGTAANAPGRPFERACHRKSTGTAMFLRATAKTQSLLIGSEPKGSNTGCT
jgi:hypothetical protein